MLKGHGVKIVLGIIFAGWVTIFVVTGIRHGFGEVLPWLFFAGACVTAVALGAYFKRRKYKNE